MCDRILCDIENGIATITLNRPEKSNCLDINMRVSIGEYIEQLGKEDGVKAIIIRANGDNFCAGGDIAEMNLIDSPYYAQALSQIEQNAFHKIQICSKPVIAAIQGTCMGAGFDMALSCDFRFISQNTKMGFPEIKIGIIVGGGGINKLTRYVGLSEAKDMLFTGKILNSYEALEKKIVNEIVEKPYEHAIEFVKNFENVSLNCIAEYKHVLHNNDIDYSNMVRESNAISRCFVHQNRQEGIQAFLEKRNPKFI